MEKKSNHQANIVRLGEPRVHTNADSLELFDIPGTGYQVVAKKGQFKAGDLGVYIQPDSVVPQTEPFRFIWENYLTEPEGKAPEKRRRITVRKFRGEWSEGLLLPITDFSESLKAAVFLDDLGWTIAPDLKLAYGWLQEGQDVSDLLGITHYDPDAGKENSKGDNEEAPGRNRWPRSLKGWFYFILRKLGLRSKNNQVMYSETGADMPVYDVEALKNYRNAFEPGEEIVVTEKIHGSNARYVFLNGKMYAGSRTLWKSPNSPCVWRKALAQNPWIEEWCRAHEGYALYGEVTPTQKGFNYGTDDVQFFAFDIRTPEGTWQKPFDPKTGVATPGVVTVPVIAFIGFDFDKIKTLVDGLSYVTLKHIREGVVITPAKERYIRGLGRLQLKLVSSEFLLKDNK